MSPEERANKFKMSVSEMTPVRRPERCAPGSAAAGMEDEPAAAPVVGEKTEEGIGRGDGGAEAWFWFWVLMAVAETEGEAEVLLLLLVPVAAPATVVVGPLVLCMAAALPPPLQVFVLCPTGPSRGVAGALGLGLALSTTHILWERVATSFATVAARVW